MRKREWMSARVEGCIGVRWWAYTREKTKAEEAYSSSQSSQSPPSSS